MPSRSLSDLFLSSRSSHPASAQTIDWDHPGEGLAIGVWDPSSVCNDVPPLVVSEIDPLQYRISVHYFRNEPFEEPPDIHEWQRRTGHDMVFNAGLFRENFSYLGLLYAQGKPLGGKRHASWMGLFVAEPTETGTARAGILDLSIDPFNEQRPPYGEAAQSLMLLDRSGKVRVNPSGKQSQQTIVGEMKNGHILLMKTTEPVSLHAIGRCLHEAYPQIRQAMAMDGGSSSDVSISPALQKAVGENRRNPFLDGASEQRTDGSYRPAGGDRHQPARAHVTSVSSPLEERRPQRTNGVLVGPKVPYRLTGKPASTQAFILPRTL